ncbi:MAG: amino acid adenylation domain-containing protein, partial [Solirubrobacteraceae bacterium]
APAPFADRARALQAQMRRDAEHVAHSGIEVLRELARRRPSEPAGAPVVFTSAVSLGELFDPAVRRSFGAPAWTISQTPGVWLDCQVTEREDDLYVNWDAVEGLFAGGVLDAMFGAFAGLLGWLAGPEDEWRGALPGLVPAGQVAVRERVNATDGPLPARGLCDGFLAGAAGEWGSRPAVVWGQRGELSYAGLRERALSVAGVLRASGVGVGDAVVVSLPKGPEQVLAVLGVLAAGGVYVPVGVEQPRARRERIVRWAGARVVIAPGDGGPWPDGVRLVSCGVQGAPVEPVRVDPDAVAYVIYTSGSTGEPKGVEVTHRAALNTIDAINDRWAVTEVDRVLAVSALDFDLSVYDIFGMLDRGGAVVIPDHDSRRDAERWCELVRAHGVTIVNCVPALLDMLLEAAGAPGLPSVRLVLLGGDWVGLDLPGRLAAASPTARFVALGGTTETAIHSTVCEVFGVPARWRSIPYGTPLRNVALRIVDSQGRDCPDWVAGELWIGGAGVAQGYRGDPQRTARQFVTHAGRRWYRTGDLGRYWPDGTLEFLGRRDHQIKLRGHRIELGEIEAAIESHPAVSRAVALLLQRPHPALAVACALRPGPPPPPLVAFAGEQLPSYMVPERWLELDELPLSANGKIDRRELRRRLEALAPDGAQEREPPRGPVEEAVAAVWCELLGVAGIGRRDSFFALGGDSLKATRLVSRLRAAGIAGAHLRGLFATPQLAEFAAGLRPPGDPAAEGGSADGPPTPLAADPARRHEPFPATDIQRAYWLGRSAEFTLGGVGSHWYWEFDGSGVNLTRLENALNALVARHEMLRAVFDADGNQRILPAVSRLSIPVTDVAAAQAPAAIAAQREAMAHAVLDPERWPLLDVRAVRCGASVRIGFGFDYIVLDALSIMIVFGELAQLYRDPGVRLPEIGMSFRDYVLGAGGHPERTEASRAYWRARLQELPPAPELPLAVDPAAIHAPRFERRSGQLDGARWAALTERARRHDLTPASVLAAAYAEVLSAWSEHPELTLNLTLFDRREVHPDVHRVLGDFTSLLLAAHRPRAGEPFTDTARRLQADVWDGMSHRDVSAVWVIRELARLRQSPEVSMPVVFTSALGVAPDGFDLSMPFGELVDGLSQTPQVWLDCQVMEIGGELRFNWDAVEGLFAGGV